MLVGGVALAQQYEYPSHYPLYPKSRFGHFRNTHPPLPCAAVQSIFTVLALRVCTCEIAVWKSKRQISSHPSTIPKVSLYCSRTEKFTPSFDHSILCTVQDPVKGYLIKWCGHPASENTWEPEENLKGCPLLLRAFLDENGWGAWVPRSAAEALATLQTLAVYKRSGWASDAAIEAHKGIVLFLLELGVPVERLNTGIFPEDYTKASVLHYLHFENSYTTRGSPEKIASKDGLETATNKDHRVTKYVHDGQFGCDPGSGPRDKSYFVDRAFWQLRCKTQSGAQNTVRDDFMSHHAGDPARAGADWGVYCTKVGELLCHLADGAGLVITAYGNGAGAAMQRHSLNHKCLAGFHRSIHPGSLMASLHATTKSAESAVQRGRAWGVTMDKAKSVIAHFGTPFIS